MKNIFSGIFNWKTTLSGLLAGVALILDTLNIVSIPIEAQETIVAATLIVIGWFAQDGVAARTSGSNNGV